MTIYYGDVVKETHSYGFVLEDDNRRDDTFIPLTEEEHMALLDEQSEGHEIVCYDGKVFTTTEHGRYYVDDDGVWQKKDDETYNKEQADKMRVQLVNDIYEIKAKKAYGGVIINNMLVFETNQTAITNTVASLALMSDTATTSWKFYTINNEPYVQLISKAQLAYIAQFGQEMINKCFAIEGKANEQLRTATVEQLVNTEWVDNFIKTVQTEVNNVDNTIAIEFAGK